LIHFYKRPSPLDCLNHEGQVAEEKDAKVEEEKEEDEGEVQINSSHSQHAMHHRSSLKKCEDHAYIQLQRVKKTIVKNWRRNLIFVLFYKY